MVMSAQCDLTAGRLVGYSQQMSGKDSFKKRTTYSQLNASRQFESKGRDEISQGRRAQQDQQDLELLLPVVAAAAVAVAVVAVF